MASAAAAVVRQRGDLPGYSEFFEEFKPHMELILLQERLSETEQAVSAAAAEEGKRLYLLGRAQQLVDAIQAAKAKLYEYEHRAR